MFGLKQKQPPAQVASVTKGGIVRLDKKAVGRMDGFVFTPKKSVEAEDAAGIASHLASEVKRRAQAMAESADGAFALDDKGQIIWQDAIIGHLIKGDTIHTPQAKALPSPLLKGAQLKAVTIRLQQLADNLTKNRLSKLHALTTPSDVAACKKNKASKTDTPSTATANGAIAQVTETDTAHAIAAMLFAKLGVVPRKHVLPSLSQLDDKAKLALARLGVRVGIDTVYMPYMLKSDAIALRSLLFSIYHNEFPPCGPPPPGRVAIDHVDGVSDKYWLAAGYRRIGKRVIRVDMLERLLAEIRTAHRNAKTPAEIPADTSADTKASAKEDKSKPTRDCEARGFCISNSMLALAGANRQQMTDILQALGYVKIGEKTEDDSKKSPTPIFMRQARRMKPRDKHHKKPMANGKHAQSKLRAKSRAKSRAKFQAESQPQSKSPTKPTQEAGKANLRPPSSKQRLGQRLGQKLGQKMAQKIPQKMPQHKPLTNGKHPPKKQGRGKRDDRALGGEIVKVVTIGPAQQKEEYNPDSPFAVLAELKEKQK